MAVHEMESLRLFTPAQGGCFLFFSSGVSVHLEGGKSALARNSSSREVIRKYITSVLRARLLQTAACTYSDDCIIIGRSTAK